MRLYDIMKDTGYTIVQGEDKEIDSITIDSRKIGKDSLFFCLKGLKVDGHEFLQSASEKGATAAIVEDDIQSVPAGITVLKVKNSRSALSRAVANYYGKPAENLQIIGVTGTNGKTSTTYFLESVLRASGKTTGLIGTVELRIMERKLDIPFATSTTPDSLELQQILCKMRDEHVTHVSMEVTSHALALNKVDGMRFAVGVFTNLTQDHLDLHGDMRNYLETKAKLFKMCDIAVINADDSSGKYIIENTDVRVVTYSIDNPSDLQAKNVKLVSGSVSFELQLDGGMVEFKAPIGGKFTVYNILGVIGAALALGVSVETLQGALAVMPGVPGRIQSVPNEFGINIIVDYAHSPDSLKNIISAVRGFTQKRVITIFGCGGDRDRAKRPIMGKIAGEMSDYAIITSDNPRTEEPGAIIDEAEIGVLETACKYEKIIDRREAIFRAIEISMPGDSIIISGKGHENYQIFSDRTIHFDDFETAREACAQRR